MGTADAVSVFCTDGVEICISAAGDNSGFCHKTELTTLTMFYDAYYDFGIIGTSLFAFIIGLTAAAVSIPVRQKKNPMTYMFYGQIAIYLGLAFFTTWFSNPTTWFWLALTLMMYWFVGYRRKGIGSHGRK